MTNATRNVMMVGVGGQGILLASEILARTAIAAGHRVKTNETHGMAQRGGSVIAQVRYGPEVFGPVVGEGAAHVLASLERIEALRFAHFLAPGSPAVVSSQAIVPVTVSSGGATYPADIHARLERVFPHLIMVDAIDLAARAGSVRAANVVVLGALSTLLDLPQEAWLDAVARCVKPATRDTNLKAFRAGQSAAGAR